eukprot:g8719.t1
MRSSGCLWKLLLLAATLPVLDCAARRPASATQSRGRTRATAGRAGTGEIARRNGGATRRTAHEKEDDFADWSGGESSEGNEYGDINDDWDSYDDEQEGGVAASGLFTDQDLDGSGSGSASYSREDDGDDLWSDDDNDISNDNYDDDMEGDSWDDDRDAPASPTSRRTRAGGAPSRRPRPSAWTGDGDRTTGRWPSGGGDRGRSRSRSGARGSSAVARYQRGRQPAPATRGLAVRMPAVSGAAIASALRRQMGTAREAVEQAGSIAASTSKKLKREVKLAVSGSWESALLKVTWPDDLPPDEALLLSMVDAVQTFKKDRDVTKNSAEHRVLLRKLWAKMSEPDWRTVSKAVYLFHSILKDLSVEHHGILKIFLGKMSREWDKKTGCRYFDLDVLCAVNEEGETFRSFVDRYGTYVFKRAEGFNARFQELDSMQDDEGWESAVTTLARAQKAIDLGMACQPEPEEETELTVLCLEHTATDIHQLWWRFHSALAWVLEEADDGDLFDGVDSAVVEECLDEFKNFYTSRYDEVVTFLLDAEELLGIYGLDVPDLRLPTAHDFDTTTIDTDTDSKGDQDGSRQAEDGSGSSSGGGGDGDGGASDDEGEDEGGEVFVSSRSGAPSRAAAAAGKSSGGSRPVSAKIGTGSRKSTARNAGTSQQQRPVAPAPGGEAAVVEGTCDTGSTEGESKALDGPQEAEVTQEQGRGAGCDAGSGEDDGGGDGDDGDAAKGSEDSGESELDDDDDGGDSDGDDKDDDDSEDSDEAEAEDSEDEGAVDEQIDDLTYFDDATQPDRSSSTDGEWER